MTNKKTPTCRYCHATLASHASMAAHYATCTVLANCLSPTSPIFPSHFQNTEATRASRADQQRGMARARARLKAEKHD